MSENQQNKPKWLKYVFSVPFLLIIVILCILIYLIVRLSNWGFRIDNDYIDQRGVYTDGRDTYDDIFPLTDDEGNYLANKSPHTILFFGNYPFSDDRDSENNVVNMIARQTGATTYNCSVSGSYLAAKSETLKYTESGLDVYNFYWLCLYLTMDQPLDYFDWLESLDGATIFPETEYLKSTLDTIDMSTVDTIAIMYDASDYLAGSMMNDPDNPENVMSFTGNLRAGLELLQAKYPTIRIIVLSPTYAFGIDDNGEYVSSDVKIYEGGATLSAYMMKECETAIDRGVSFVDNVYGTFNEDEAPEFLEDHLHVNQKGRELLVKRFISALTKYDNK